MLNLSGVESTFKALVQDTSYQPNPSGQQFLHHALLEGAGFIAAGFESGDFGVCTDPDFLDTKIGIFKNV